jgi:hypothetical protein
MRHDVSGAMAGGVSVIVAAERIAGEAAVAEVVTSMPCARSPRT